MHHVFQAQWKTTGSRPRLPVNSYSRRLRLSCSVRQWRAAKRCWVRHGHADPQWQGCAAKVKNLLDQGAAQNYDHDTSDEAHLVVGAGCWLSSCSRLCIVSSRTTCRLLLIMKSAILHSSQVHVTCTSVRQSHDVVTVAYSRQATQVGDSFGAWPWSRPSSADRCTFGGLTASMSVVGKRHLAHRKAQQSRFPVSKGTFS